MSSKLSFEHFCVNYKNITIFLSIWRRIQATFWSESRGAFCLCELCRTIARGWYSQKLLPKCSRCWNSSWMNWTDSSNMWMVKNQDKHKLSMRHEEKSGHPLKLRILNHLPCPLAHITLWLHFRRTVKLQFIGTIDERHAVTIKRRYIIGIALPEFTFINYQQRPLVEITPWSHFLLKFYLERCIIDV